MEHLKATLEAIYRGAIQQEFDRIILVIGDEGVGKSTLMLSASMVWTDIRGLDVNPDDVLNKMVWGDRSEFKRAIVESERQSIITVQDAARILHKKESMTGEQVDLQKSLLDSRFKENLILLGFQAWDDIPSFMQRRRAKNAFVIPRRGYVKGYNRSDLDHRFEEGDWPDPRFRDQFPSLEGLDIWDEFKRRDREHKEDRLLTEEDFTPSEIRKQVQAKVALRAVKPGDPNAGMTQREAAKLIDYSQGWISDRVQDWKDGDLDVDLSDELDKPQASAVGD